MNHTVLTPLADSPSIEISDGDIREVVRCAIKDAIAASSPPDRPFLVLREAGVVAEVRAAINARLNKARTTSASVTDRSSAKRSQGTDGISPRVVETLRVQLEVKAYEGDMFDTGGGIPRTDLVVLRKNARLHCWPHGAGDVVLLIPANDISALVEVKASPSFNIGEVLRYARDIEHLLGVMHQQPPHLCSSAHFLLIDKSLRHFGMHDCNRESPPLTWGFEVTPERCLSSLLEHHPAGKGKRTKTTNTIRDLIRAMCIRIGPSEPPSGAPFVEIYGIQRDGSEAPLRKFAYKAH